MLNKNKDAKRLVEAILFAADEPLDIETIKSKIELNVDVLKILKELQSEFIDRGINLYEISNKWSFRTADNLSKKIASEVVQQRKLSKATIETLAIIAYHQPVTRSEIEEIRGVSFSTGTLEILFELGWVKPNGRKEIPGKPLLYVTTDTFLSHFNLKSLSDLPNSEELASAGLIDSRLDRSIFGTNKFAQDDLEKVSKEFGVPTVTDIHTNEDAAMAAEYVDVLQIPAFLVRQTDLVVAAAKTGKTVNLKKGQFMSPESMKHAVQKVLDCQNENIMVTDRGTMFGYQDMIVDFRGIPTMQNFATTVLDVTHSLQQPNQMTGVTGGRPDMIETIAKAGIAVGVDGIFIETHFDPSNAKSDGANMLHLDYFEDLMTKLVAIRKTVNQF